MSSVIGGIEIQMLADLSRLKSDMDQAKGIVGTASNAMKTSADFVKGAFIGIASGLTLHAFTAWMKGAIDAADATKAFAQKTGLAAGEVAGLQLAFKQGGVGSDQLTTGMSKLQKQMVEGNKTFDQLGIKTRNTDGSMRSTKDVLYDTADAFAGMADGSAKSTLAMEIFGKTGAEMIPTLNEGSAGLRDMAEMAAKLGLVIDTDTAEAADKFNDTTELLGLGLQGIARQTMAQLLPALNSLAGGFLEGMTSGNALTQVSSALATGMKGLYTVLVGGVQIVNTFGKTLGALGAQLFALANGDFKLMMNIGKEWMADIKTDWSSTIKNVGSVWDGSAGQSVAAMAKVTKTQKDLVLQTKDQETAAKKAADAAAKHAEELKKLTSAGADYLAHQRQANETTQREIDLGRSLTAAEAAQLDLTRKLTEGKLVMNSATEASARAEIVLAGQLAINKQWLKETAAENNAAADAVDKKTAAVIAETEKQREANQALGMTTAALGDLKVARLLEMAAAADKKAQWEEEFILVNGNTSAQRELAQAYRESAAEAQTGVHLVAAKEAAEEWKKTALSIQESMTDALFRAMEEGKSLWLAFRDTLVNTFKTTVLRPIISAVMSPITGAMGSMFLPAGASAAGSAGGGAGGLGSMLGMGGMTGLSGIFGAGASMAMNGGFGTAMQGAGSMMANGSVMQGAAQGAGALAPYAAGAAVGVYGGRAISNGYSAIGSSGNSAVNVGTIIGAVVGGPIGAAIGGAIGGVVNRAFGTKTSTTGTGITGTISGSDFAGNSFADWQKKGGWFRSSSSGTKLGALEGDALDALRSSSAAVFAQIKSYAQVLALPASAIDNVTKSIRIQLGDDQAANELAISKVFADYQEQLAQGFSRTLDRFKKSGETYTEALERLSGIQRMTDQLQEYGGVFSRIAMLSVTAKDELIGFAGSIDALITKTQKFVGNYYTESEQVGIAAEQVFAQLRAAGVEYTAARDLRSRADFRALVESTDVTTSVGRAKLNSLLDISAQFAAISQYIEDNGKTLGTAGVVPQRADLLSSILNASSANAPDVWTPATFVPITDGLTQVNNSTAAVSASVNVGIAALIAKLDLLQAQVKDSGRVMVDAIFENPTENRS